MDGAEQIRQAFRPRRSCAAVICRTDHTQAEALRAFAITGQLADYLPPELRGKDAIPMAKFRLSIMREVLVRAVAKLKLTPAELLDLNGYRELPQPPAPDQVYKAGPRDGVWATPPFLHNGSVPNLYEMLVPASERSKKFCIGREFEPIKVGLDTTCGPGMFVMVRARLETRTQVALIASAIYVAPLASPSGLPRCRNTRTALTTEPVGAGPMAAEFKRILD